MASLSYRPFQNLCWVTPMIFLLATIYLILLSLLTSCNSLASRGHKTLPDQPLYLSCRQKLSWLLGIKFWLHCGLPIFSLSIPRSHSSRFPSFAFALACSKSFENVNWNSKAVWKLAKIMEFEIYEKIWVKWEGFLMPIRPFSFISKVTIIYSWNLGQNLSYVSKLGFLVDNNTPIVTISCLLIDDELFFDSVFFFSVLTFLFDWENDAWISQNIYRSNGN